jgi:ribosome maturation factor RimP
LPALNRYSPNFNGYLILKGNIWLVKGNSLTFAAEKDVRRERGRSLLLLYPMNSESQIQALEQKVLALIGPEPGFFLVEVKIKPTNNVKIFIDADQGISIEKLVSLNRRLYKDLEENVFFSGGDFSLEVSSPGLDEPLRIHRQYLKNIGREVEVLLIDGVKNEGKLIAVTNEEITVEEEKGKGKKKEIIQHSIPFTQIKTTKIQIKF